MKLDREKVSKKHPSTHESVLLWGRTENNLTHSEGVVLMLPREAEKALIEVKAVNSIIRTSTFRDTST